MELQSRYDTTCAAGGHAEADQVKPLLTEARQALLIAEATTAGLRTAQEAIAREQAEDAHAAQLAEQQARTQEVIDEAIQDLSVTKRSGGPPAHERISAAE